MCVMYSSLQLKTCKKELVLVQTWEYGRYIVFESLVYVCVCVYSTKVCDAGHSFRIEVVAEIISFALVMLKTSSLSLHYSAR